MARTEAVAAWAEMLRDTLAAGGFREAILASRRVAPAPIAAQVGELAERSEYAPLGVALRQFAHAVDDPVADHVVAALVVATERQAAGLRDMLGRIAASAREQAGDAHADRGRAGPHLRPGPVRGGVHPAVRAGRGHHVPRLFRAVRHAGRPGRAGRGRGGVHRLADGTATPG